MLLPISTEHGETRHRPIANLSIIAFTCLVSIVLMNRLDAAMLASLLAHGDPTKLDGWFRHLPLVRASADPLQLVGHTLLHAGGWHLLGNMVLLLALGNPVNARLGQLRYLLLYAVSAAVAAIGWLVFSDGRLMIGASGAVIGVVGAFLVLFPLTRVNVLFWATGLGLGVFALVWKYVLRMDDPVALLSIAGAITLGCTIYSFQSLSEHTPPEGWLLRMLGFWTFPVAGFWVVLWFVGWDVAAIVGNVGGNVAHEAHLGGALGGIAIATGLALTGVVRGTRDDPTLPELVGVLKVVDETRPGPRAARSAGCVPPQDAPLRPTPTFAALPPTRRYNQALTFSDYARKRRSA